MQDVSILIFACGRQDRWAAETGEPDVSLKQLVPILGEPLMQRTARQLGSRHYTLVTNRDALKLYAKNVYEQPTYSSVIELALKTKHLWSERTVWLLGDVCWADEDLKEVLYRREPLTVFGNVKQDETMAVSFSKEKSEDVEYSLYRTLANHKRGGDGTVWEFYRHIAGISLRLHRIEDKIFKQVYKSGDFDSKKRYWERIGALSTEAHEIL